MTTWRHHHTTPESPAQAATNAEEHPQQQPALVGPLQSPSDVFFILWCEFVNRQPEQGDSDRKEEKKLQKRLKGGIQCNRRYALFIRRLPGQRQSRAVKFS